MLAQQQQAHEPVRPAAAWGEVDDPVKVAYIAGMGRSGSTLLEQLLVREYGWLSIGELNQVWRRGLKGNALCVCGARFHDCGFWRDAIAHAFGSIDDAPVERALALQAATLRMRYVPRYQWAALRGASFRRDFEAYQQLMHALLVGIRAISGAAVILDSSKVLPAAYTLALHPGVELGIVHLIRDPRAVSFSWTRVKQTRDGSEGQAAQLARFNPLRTAVEWDIVNCLFEHLGKHMHHPPLRCRYEDLVAKPDATIARIEQWADGLFGANASHAPQHGQGHGIGGNPMRFDAGPIRIKADDAWRHEMSAATRAAVSLIAGPVMWRYGYRWNAALRPG